MLLLGSHTNERDKPVDVVDQGLLHHSLVVGQSGSGKSFFIARLIEEILLRTRARVVIIDPNGDFRALSNVNDAAWLRHKEEFSRLEAIAQRKGTDSFDTPGLFGEAWAQRRFTYLTPAGPPAGATDTPMVLHRRLYVHWDQLDDDENALLLRIDPAAQPNARIALEEVMRNSAWNHNRLQLPYGYDLRAMRESAELFAGHNLSLANYPNAKNLTTDDWYSVRVAVAEVIRKYRLWWSNPTDRGSTMRPPGISDFISGALESQESETYWDALLISLDAARRDDTLLAVDSTLSELWKRTKDTWRRRFASGSEDADQLVPTFIVVDEAHNFAPRSSLDPLAQRVSDRLLQIASEGRKYGLYLILATQRPTKLHTELVPECENSCVLRVQSALEIQFASQVLGIPEKLAAGVSEYTTGQGLMSGRWVGGAPTVMTAAPARSVVGGGGVGSDWIRLRSASSPFAPNQQVRLVSEYVRASLQESHRPMTLAALAAGISQRFDFAQPPDWMGSGGFRELLDRLQVPHLGVRYTPPPGFAYLTDVHGSPSGKEEYEISRDEVSSVTLTQSVRDAFFSVRSVLPAIPVLPMEAYRAIYESLSIEVQQSEFNLSEVGKAVRDATLAAGHPAPRSAVTFVMYGIYRSGHTWERDLPQDPATLAKAFWSSLLTSLTADGVELHENDLPAFRDHVTGGLLQGSDDSPPPIVSAPEEVDANGLLDIAVVPKLGLGATGAEEVLRE